MVPPTPLGATARCLVVSLVVCCCAWMPAVLGYAIPVHMYIGIGVVGLALVVSHQLRYDWTGLDGLGCSVSVCAAERRWGADRF